MSVSRAERDEIMGRFHRLMRDFAEQTVSRNCFQPWEIALLLDFEDCPQRLAASRQLMKQYQRAFEREVEHGSGEPLKLSEFLRQKQDKKPA